MSQTITWVIAMDTKHLKGTLWEAHVKKAASSPYHAKQYKRFEYDLDPHRINAQRIRNGEAVGEMWLRGQLKEELMEFHGLTEADFKPYTG